MAKSKKRKPLQPRVKRMKRPARLESAKSWIPTYTGKHLLRGYCNHYGVNWRCAAVELKIMGVEIDPMYLATRERSEAELAIQRKTKKVERKSPQNKHWHPFTDAQSAYLAGDFPALHELEMREQYGDDWERRVMNKSVCCDDTIDEETD